MIQPWFGARDWKHEPQPELSAHRSPNTTTSGARIYGGSLEESQCRLFNLIDEGSKVVSFLYIFLPYWVG